MGHKCERCIFNDVCEWEVPEQMECDDFYQPGDNDIENMIESKREEFRKQWFEYYENFYFL